ncbi:MAG: diaminobutyrate--2-oxoglutarate transaminase [Dehalococcoidia bacterium]
MDTFEQLESEVRGYCRSWPTVFRTARGSRLTDVDGREYIDFFAGAGVLNYGHNDPQMRARLIEYLSRDGILHGLDMATRAKQEFLETFDRVILKPRGLDYKIQFPGPTGTNAVEAALKLARKVTGRELVVGFTNAFHGMTLGSLAVTGNEAKRAGAGVPLHHSVSMPYDGFLGDDVDTIAYLQSYLDGSGTGVSLPAAVIVETVQAEGGVNVASDEWLRRLAVTCKDHDILLIVDDIQAGCGRTGPFFSFESAGVTPDIVCLSKSLSGFGQPMALTLIRRDLDVWNPGEHNGTFRGNNAAFVTATEALRYWTTDELTREVLRKSEVMKRRLEAIAARFPAAKATWRGRGMIQGLYCEVPGLASKVTRAAFERGLIIETSGPEDEVVKLLPPLVIDDETLQQGLDIIEASFAAVTAANDAPALATASA